jgi:hypothetical protein
LTGIKGYRPENRHAAPQKLRKQMDRCWHLACLAHDSEIDAAQQGDKNVQDRLFSLAPSASLFSRLMATIDRLLMASTRIAIRNGDLPHFGL